MNTVAPAGISGKCKGRGGKEQQETKAGKEREGQG